MNQVPLTAKENRILRELTLRMNALTEHRADVVAVILERAGVDSAGHQISIEDGFLAVIPRKDS